MCNFSKRFKSQINFRGQVGKRLVSAFDRKYLDRPILLVYHSDGTLFDLLTLSTAKFLVKNDSSYFDGCYTELRYYF